MVASIGRAVVLGATGLVGGEILRHLLATPDVGEVVALSRRPLESTHARLSVEIVDFDRPETLAPHLRGDVVFCALGTTLRKAGGQAEQAKVDRDYPVLAAKLARANGVDCFVLISSARADAETRAFYFRLKGELEDQVRHLAFRRTRILRPSFLDGEREESRPLERAALVTLRHLPRLAWLSRLRPVPIAKVAALAVESAREDSLGQRVYESDEIFAFSS